MNPFVVYMLMMADNLSTGLTVIGVLTTTAFVVLTLTVGINSKGSYQSQPDWELEEARIEKLRKRFRFAPFLLLLGLLMPSTKTVAAMIVLPKLTSPAALNAMSNEAKDLYGLAKDALARLGKDNAPAAKTPEK